MFRDDSGHFIEYLTNVKDKVVEFFNAIYEDCVNYDPNNEDEQAVFKANYFSVYKGGITVAVNPVN